MSFNISSGITAKAQKVVLYGVEGIGKSTFASQFPMPLYIDTEGSTTNMNVNRLPNPTSWTMLLQEVDYVKQNQLCETLIIDTADWAEKICKEHLAALNKWTDSSNDYGAKYIALEKEFGQLLNKLTDIVQFGTNVVITAHAKLKKKEEPDQMGAYDRYQLKLEDRTSALLKEWADMVLFVNYETTIVTDSKTQSKKATGGRRVMHTTHHPAWDAKNRHNLPEELPFDFGSIAHIFQKAPVTQPQLAQTTYIEPVQEDLTGFDQAMAQTDPKFQRELLPLDPSIDASLYQLMEANGVTELEVQTLVANKGWMPFETLVKDYPADLVQGALVAQWNMALKEIQANRIF